MSFKRFLRSLRLGVAAGALALAVVSTAQAFECTTLREADALDTRVIQNHAMVAALSCGERGRYNTFVRTFQSDLATQGTVLRQYFHRAYGSQGKVRLDSFVTSLANRESRRSLSDRAAYCSEASSLFDGLSTLTPGYLAEFASSRPVSQDHGFAACEQRALNEPAQTSAIR
jgi:hypothetical protein